MSSKPSHAPTKRVVDEEGTVDQQLKRQIINARKRVDDREDTIFVQAPLEKVDFDRQQLVQMWKVSVRQYLKRIEPLLISDEIPRSDHYYTGEQIVQREVYPPDGKTKVVKAGNRTTEHINWSLFDTDQIPLRDLARSHELVTVGFEPPEPKQYIIKGIKGVIDNPQQVFEWDIILNPNAWGAERAIAFPKTVATPQRQDLEYAVRLADQFLQEEAGIAVEIGHEETDDKDENPF